jgi:hypothetical protein
MRLPSVTTMASTWSAGQFQTIAAISPRSAAEKNMPRGLLYSLW